MNYVESLFDSISKGIKQVNGEFPYDIESYCIGSGSNFVVHKYISSERARELYAEYKSRLPLGRRISSKDNGSYVLECFNTMESSIGSTYTFMFKVEEVVEHNPNDILDEWYEKNKKNKEFVSSILDLLIKDKESKK